MERLAIALCICLAFAPGARAKPLSPGGLRPAQTHPDAPVSCADIQAAMAHLTPGQEDERNRLQALYQTNGCLDPAFTRRLKTITAEPLPDAATRADIWRQSLPAEPVPQAPPR